MWLDFTYSTTQREMCELNDNVSNVLNQRIIILIETQEKSYCTNSPCRVWANTVTPLELTLGSATFNIVFLLYEICFR